MAISPNTNFTAGQILTATQQNQFPRGIMQLASSTALQVSTVTEAVALTLPSFTAVANRYYRITYFEPYIQALTANTEVALRLRLTNLTGTQLALGDSWVTTINGTTQVTASVVTTLTAGSTVIVGTIVSGFTANANGSATQPRQLWVEDIGPA